MAYPWTSIFSDLGNIIASSDLIEVGKDTTDALIIDTEEHFNNDVDEIAYAQTPIANLTSYKGSIDSTVLNLVSALQKILTDLIPEPLESTYQDWATIFADMKTKMVEESQTIQCNETGISFVLTESGDNNIQLTGYENISGITSATLDASDSLYYSITDRGGGRWRVEIFDDVGRASGNQIGHTYDYTTTGIKTIIPDNGSGLAGTIRVVRVFCGDNDIAVLYELKGTRTGNGTIALEATQMAIWDDIRIECTSAGTAGSEKWRIYTRTKGQIAGSSGLITTAVEFDPASDNNINDLVGLKVTITAGGVNFVVGDTFEFQTMSNDTGVFQTYFRDKLERVLPCALHPTISDEYAEYGTTPES